MSFAAMFTVGTSVLKGVSGILTSRAETKMLKKQRNEKRRIVNAEFNYNKGQLEKGFISGSLINFENMSKAMGEATTQVLSNLSSYNLNTIDIGGGTSYNSSKSELVNSVSNDYNVMMRDIISTRDYNEYSLVKNMNDNMYQLELDRNKQLYGIDTSYGQYKNAINDKMLSNIFQTAGDVLGTVRDNGGIENVFSKGKNDTTLGNFFTTSLGFGGVK